VTTIAYRDGVIAADTLISCGNHRDGSYTKIAKRGRLLGGSSGSAAEGYAWLRWFEAGCKGEPPKMLKTNAFIAQPNGTLVFFGEDGSFPFKPNGEFYAIGSGCEYAVGAMAFGASAPEAVRIAMQFDSGSAGEITVLRAN
jgi:ATP-dependent protease HslVU (ClpYQ) peptidase subunit